ncbi:MAG: anthranilate synthase component I family protein, partial [Patescibacteria group bacterium]
DIGTPGIYFAYYDKVIVIDNKKKQMWFIAFSDKLLKEIEKDLKTSLNFKKEYSAGNLPKKPKSNLTLKQYKGKILEIKDKLREGETYQVNFSQRFSCSYGKDPFELYEKLYKINPSPYSCFIDGELSVISCSPERLFAINGGKINVRPIKGTVPRGKNAAEDKKMIAKLKASLKDDAELSMIVDLYRNDIGKVCKAGTVKVKKHRRIEKYSHVIHTVSIVEGELRKNAGIDEIIEAMFPGGSVTGCPKKRTMEIINRLEDYARGLYCGSAGYISFDGNSDFNILIRTFAYRDGNLYFHGGGGIVTDSDADSEYKETLDKVEALMRSL